MPTSGKVKEALLSNLPEGVEGMVFELGSGWGTLAIPLAKILPRCRVVAFETSPLPYWISRFRVLWSQSPNLEMKREDFFQVPLGEAKLVVCYLYPGAMRALKKKFEAELSPGTWVVSNTFAIPGWTPLEVIEVTDMYRTKIYFYRC